MTRYALVLFVTLSALAAYASEDPLAPARIQADSQLGCSCSPDHCLNDPRYPARLQDKKKTLKKDGYPIDLIDLLDLDGKCVAQVDISPVGFSIMSVTVSGDKTISSWTTDQEEAVKRGVLKGNYREYYKFNAQQAFSCCGEPNYKKRPDWDSELSMNKDLAIRCSKSGSAVVCKKKRLHPPDISFRP